MRRVRVVFALLALALLGAAVLLVQRAVASLEAERSAQRTTLAARVFDEMERVLSEFLQAEESLPFGGWIDPARVEPGFVAGRFELAPGAVLRLAPGTPPALGLLLSAWAERRAAPAEEAPLARAGAGRTAKEASVEGTLRAAKDESVEGKLHAAKEADAPAAAASPPAAAQESVYDALQSLNRGAELRAQRARKLEETPEAEAGSVAQAAGKPHAARALAARPEAASQDAQRQTTPAAPASRPVVRAARVAVDPLLGDRLDEADEPRARLVLARTVLAGDRGYRQGLVLDAEALGTWLRARVLPGETLPGVALGVRAATSPGAAAPAGAFVHRFAEPFDALEATLSLPPLPATGSADTVLGLSLLLVAAGGACLFALYRMVAVAIGFAEQRSNFVAAVSHELKTPLTAIRMYGEMLRDGLVPTDEKRTEYYRTITAESERLSRLIDNVLEFARSERKDRSLALRTGELGAEVATLCDALRPHAAESGFALDVAVGPGLPSVRFDRDAVAQILVNLVDNALKYARGAMRREVRVECAAEDDRVVLRVRDHGPGVPPRELGRVFELFHRGESELTRTTRGTGLGLALVRSLARRMGARVSARNPEGGGFEVTLAFPTAPATGRAAADDVASRETR